MGALLRVVVFVLYPLLLGNAVLWWDVHRLGTLVALLAMLLAPRLVGDDWAAR